jgi:Spx/MgsR family transcriptional regulator
MIKIYGISNCDSVKKAIKFFNLNKIEFVFYDYKKDINIINTNDIKNWLSKVGVNKLLNKRSTTYKNLDESELDKNKIFNNCDDKEVIELLNKHKLLIKRPIVIYGDNCFNVIVGFKQDIFESEFL